MPSRPDEIPASETTPLQRVLQTANRIGDVWPGRGRPAGAVPAGVLDALPDPVVVVDAEDRVRTANRAVREVFGLDPEVLVDRALAETLFDVAHREAYVASLARLADGGDAETGRLVVAHADGSSVPVSATFRRADGAEGDLVVVTLRDARQAETTDAHRRALRAVLDVLPDAVVAADRTGRVLYRNPAAKRDHAGPSPGRRLTDDLWRAAEAAMRSDGPAEDQEEVDADGRVRLTTRIPVRGSTGAVVGLVSVSRDVTAQKADEARLLDEKEAAETAARANREVLATTSHEVRTLMSGVTGMTTLLLDTDLDEKQQDFVETIQTSSTSLLRIVNDVLDLSKIEAGMLDLEQAPFEVRRVLGGALSAVMQQAAAKGVALKAELADDVPAAVVGDAGRVQQILANLLTNAVKFTDEGTVRIRVERSADGPDVVSFAVEDSGVGIAPDRLDAVFKEYVQADASTSRTHGGTGLGLAICRQLVEAMGGELTAMSTPGQGSVFRFTIALPAAPPEADPVEPAPMPPARIEPAPAPVAPPPVVPAAATAPPAPEAAPEPAPLAPVAPVPAEAPAAEPEAAAPGTADALPKPGEPRRARTIDAASIIPSARVLLVEDDPTMQKVTAHTLLRLGYRATVVDNGSKAVLAVRAQPFDVVLMDIMMPVMNGLVATQHIRQDPGPHPAPAIVALSANAMKGDRERGLAAGCDDYLTKPVDPRHLAATIERAIRARRAEAEAAEAAA